MIFVLLFVYENQNLENLTLNESSKNISNPFRDEIIVALPTTS